MESLASPQPDQEASGEDPDGKRRWRLSPETRARISLSKQGEKNPMYGKTHSAQARQRISQANIGRKLSEETKNRIRLANLGKEVPEETRARISSSKQGEKNPMYGKSHSEATKARLRAGRLNSKHSEVTKAKIGDSKTGENNPSWDKNIAAVKQAISLHIGGMTMKQASQELGYSPSWLSDWKRRHPARFSDFYLSGMGSEGSIIIEASELQLARSRYDEFDYGDDNKELLALRYGFGIYRRHTYDQIGAICGRSQVWAMQHLEQIMSGQTSPSHCLEFSLEPDSRLSVFHHDSHLTTRQMQNLADLLPRLGRLETEIAARLFCFGGRRREAIAEINQNLFQSSAWGEIKILNLKRELERQIGPA